MEIMQLCSGLPFTLMDHYASFPGLLLILMSELLHSTFGSKKANGLQSPFGPAPLRPRVREKSPLTAGLVRLAERRLPRA